MTALLQAAALIVLAAAALYAFWRSMWGKPPADVPGVLTYHKIARFELGGTWMSPRRFEGQIASLLDSGFTFIREKDFIDTLEGNRPAGDREILLTFDDGYDCVASAAAPVLEKAGVPALVFLVSGFTGRENDWELGIPGRKARHMGPATIAELSGRGFSFGSHGVTHRPLTRMSREEALEEMVRSKADIEEMTGREVLSLSYPFGRGRPDSAALAAEAGYRAAFTLYPPAGASGADPYMVRRDGVWVIDTPATIRIKLARGRLFWLEDLKGRAVNAVADLVPMIKGV